MEAVRRTMKRIPSFQAPLPTTVPIEAEKGRGRFAAQFAFFRRPLRLKGNSTISVPLGVVLLFPCIVVIIVLILFVRHPSSPVGNMVSSGKTPPKIRYDINGQSIGRSSDMILGKLVRSMIRYSSQVVWSRTLRNHEQTRHLLY